MMDAVKTFFTIQWRDGIVRLLDQRKLPEQTVYNDYTDYTGLAAAIQEMVVRGAPAIGVTAAYGLAQAAHRAGTADLASARAEIRRAAEVLGAARPTAVNLSWAIARMMKIAMDPAIQSVSELAEALLAEANAIAAEDVRINKAIAMNAQPLVPDPAVIIHHCNTGSLGTVDYGTALGIIRMAHELGKNVFCLADETRPRLQGARLTAWELQQYGVPFKVIADGASGHYMRTLGVDLCVVGCDRVAANGDTANKIGTYNLAVVAHENGVPFYVAAPTTTIDMDCPTGDDIPIEERPAREVTHIGEHQITPDDTPAGNPAFDVTPARYISAIITEKGVAYPPFKKSLAKLMAG
jgi:methylthioribose-1-phosphate isomerase